MLNDRKEVSLLEVFVSSILPNFLEVHLEWARINSNDLKVSPIQLNTVYKKYQTKFGDFEMDNMNNDYNTLVEEIVHIAPSYEKSELENNSEVIREEEEEKEEKMVISYINEDKEEGTMRNLPNIQNMNIHDEISTSFKIFILL